MKRVLVTCKYIFPFIKSLKQKKIKFILSGAKQFYKEKELIKKIKNFDGLICGDDEITKKVIDVSNKLKVISKWGTGIDSINLKYAKKNNIKVYNTPNAFTKGVAQLALGLALNLSREIIKTHIQIQRGGWPKNEGRNLFNLKIGIIGYGNIGKEIHKYVKVISNNIKIYDIKKEKVPKILFDLKSKICRQSDVIFLATDLNKSSYHIIDKKEFEQFKKNLILINIARGPLINERYIAKYADIKNIKFGLDVFENEPLPKKSQFKKLKNCIISSHNAFNTKEDVLKTNMNTYKNLLKGL